MKPKYLFFTLCAIAILFSSCAELSTLSVEKRHYRKGYYVDYQHTRSNEASVKNTVETEPTAEVIAKDLYDSPVTVAEKEGEPVIVPQKRSENSIPAIQDSKVTKEGTPSIKPSRASRSNSVISRFAEKKFNLPEREEDELSMFWSVIVLIVIVWLIAYFTGGWGLGGLIHLLLLVALILFILWLLRVV